MCMWRRGILAWEASRAHSDLFVLVRQVQRIPKSRRRTTMYPIGSRFHARRDAVTCLLQGRMN
jgi:hypothetical protein